MKIAIISDIHSNIYGLDAVLKDISEVDKILCAGDLTGYYPFVNQIIEKCISCNIISVRGNHDHYVVNGGILDDNKESIKTSVELTKKLISKKNLDYIKNLPKKIQANIDGKKILMVHGSPWDVLEGRIYPDYEDFDKFLEIHEDVVILGHTHYPFIKKIGNLTIVNPGSCGQPRDYNLLSYVLWDTKTNVFKNKRVNFNIEEFKKKAMEENWDEELFKVFKRVKR